MHAYFVYGLVVRSEFPLPELCPAEAQAHDVIIRAGELPPGAPPAPDVKSWVQGNADASETLCVYEDVGRFAIRDSGREIVVDGLPGVDAGLVRHALIGPVMAQLLWQRGLFTLHASVVRIHAHAAAFVGVSGEGKSTTAAALDGHGHELVCDDIAAIPWQELPIRALPGFPRIRLFPDSVAGVGDDPSSHPLIHALIDKRLKPAQAFAAAPTRVDKIYVLAQGPEPRAELLSKREALMELLKNSYNPSQLAPIVGFAKHMQMAAKVAEHVPVYRLERPKDLARLPELVRFIEAHVAT